MAINFPNSPSLGQLYNFSGTTWQWSGEYWNVYSAQTGYITSVSNAGNGYPVIDSVTSNALTLKSFSGTNLTITDSGGQLNFYVPLNGGGGGQLYYFNISKTQTPYLELATTATTSAQQTITSATTSGNTVTLGQFLTPSGYPGVSIIPGGVWSFYLHSYKQNSSASFDIFCDVYKRTTGGTETFLFSTDPAPVLSDSPTPIMELTDTYYSGTTLDTSDRILVNVRATNTSNNTYSITFVSEGSQHYSYVSSPLLLRTTDIYVDSFTYTPSANTITIGQTESYPPQEITINSFSGLTINGNLNVTGDTTISSGLTANTLTVTEQIFINSATAKLSLYDSTNLTYNVISTQETGILFSSGLVPNEGFASIQLADITGDTEFRLGLISQSNSVTLTNVDVTSNRIHKLPNNDGTLVLTVNNISANTSGNISIDIPTNYLPLSGGTVSGATEFTNGISANTISATTYLNVNAVTGGSFSNNILTLSGTGNVNGTQITGFTSGGGEVNTASNLGSGTGLFAQKSGVDLEFKSLTSTGNTVTITSDSNTVNLESSSSPGGGITWNSSNTTQSMSADNGYVTTASTLTTFTLPSTITFGKTVEIAGNSTGLWQLNQNSGQQIRFGNTATTVTSGILSATSQGDCIKLICTSANTSFIVTSSMGNIFFS